MSAATTMTTSSRTGKSRSLRDSLGEADVASGAADVVGVCGSAAAADAAPCRGSGTEWRGSPGTVR